MKLLSIVLILGMLVAPLTAIAETELKCSLIQTDGTSKEEIYHINPKYISYLSSLTDTSSVAVGNSGRYVLMVSMTNGDNLIYGTYRNEQSRKNVINYLYKIVRVCNQ